MLYASHTEKCRSLNHSRRNPKQGDMLGNARWLYDQGVQLIDAMDGFRCECRDLPNLFDARMQSCGLFKLQSLRCAVAFPAELLRKRGTAGIEVVHHTTALVGIGFVGATLEARRKTHLHLRVNATRKCRIRMQIVHAAPQLEEIERV